MLEIFVYPVSAVMKFWHIFLHSFLGWDDSVAWGWSILGLIVVVRTLIAPLQLAIYKSGRVTTIIRPLMADLKAEYAEAIEPELLRERKQKEKDIKKEYGYKASAGCIPPLIQIPVFLGLYQVLLRMARPEEGLDASFHKPIGVLQNEDIHAFLNAKIGDVALPAYIAMEPAQFEHLGTTYEAVYALNFPLILLAGLITSTNVLISTIRNYYIMDQESRMGEFSLHLMLWMVPIVPLLLLQAGVMGPIPTAIVIYWAVNNFTTLTQNLAIYLYLFRTMPMPASVKAFQTEKRLERIARAKARRKFRWQKRRAWFGYLFMPWQWSKHKAHRAEAKAYFRELKQTRKDEKAQQQALEKLRNEARAEERKREREEKEAAKSNNPPEEQPAEK